MIRRSWPQDVAAYLAGVEGTGVLHGVKHFPGHGRVSVDSHEALPVLDVDAATWWEEDALPFRVAVEAGVPMVMLGSSGGAELGRAAGVAVTRVRPRAAGGSRVHGGRRQRRSRHGRAGDLDSVPDRRSGRRRRQRPLALRRHQRPSQRRWSIIWQREVESGDVPPERVAAERRQIAEYAARIASLVAESSLGSTRDRRAGHAETV